MTRRYNFPSRKVLAIALALLIAPSLLLMAKNVVVEAIKPQDKVIEKKPTRRSPVFITHLKSKDKDSKHLDLKFSEKFSGGENWLKDLSFSIANTSSKPIVYMELYLDFPETADASGRKLSHKMVFGQKPSSKFLPKSTPLHLKPADKIDVVVEKEYDKITKLLESKQSSASNLGQVSLSNGLIIFEDKTGYMAGTFYLQDSNNPDKYIPTGSSPSTVVNQR